jgi:glucose/arabinose dehydrogenase
VSADRALRVIENDILLPTPFAVLPVDANGERGLLGVAVDPAFTSNHFVYVYYTATTPAIHNRVSRFTANGNVAVPGSEVDPARPQQPQAPPTNHNGGAIHFGLDGKLYIAVGENANTGNSQTLNQPAWQSAAHQRDAGQHHSDRQPFFNDPNVVGVNKAIWAMGLRNPFTFSVNPVNGQNLHQRRRTGRVGRDQHRRAGRQLRLAHLRRQCLWNRRRRRTTSRRCTRITT